MTRRSIFGAVGAFLGSISIPWKGQTTSSVIHPDEKLENDLRDIMGLHGKKKLSPTTQLTHSKPIWPFLFKEE